MRGTAARTSFVLTVILGLALMLSALPGPVADGGGSKGPADDTSCTCLILSDMIAFRVGGDLTRAMCPPFQDGNHEKHNVR